VGYEAGLQVTRPVNGYRAPMRLSSPSGYASKISKIRGLRTHRSGLWPPASAGENHDHRPLGKSWVEGFLNRHPELRASRYGALETESSKQTLALPDSFFDDSGLPEIRAIDPSNRWNVDEVGLLQGRGVDSRTCSPASLRST
jgi:hypothetical protein